MRSVICEIQGCVHECRDNSAIHSRLTGPSDTPLPSPKRLRAGKPRQHEPRFAFSCCHFPSPEGISNPPLWRGDRFEQRRAASFVKIRGVFMHTAIIPRYIHVSQPHQTHPSAARTTLRVFLLPFPLSRGDFLARTANFIHFATSVALFATSVTAGYSPEK
jgi:hypothetical protein